MYDPESILDPDVTPVPMPEAVFQGSFSSLYQRTQFFQDSGSILWMEPLGPEVWILSIPKTKSDSIDGEARPGRR